MMPSEYCRVRAPRHCTSAVYRPAATRTERLIRFLNAGAAISTPLAELSANEHWAASGVSSCISNRPRPTLNVERNPRLNVPVSKRVCRVYSWPGAGRGAWATVTGGVAAGGCSATVAAPIGRPSHRKAATGSTRP